MRRRLRRSRGRSNDTRAPAVPFGYVCSVVLSFCEEHGMNVNNSNKLCSCVGTTVALQSSLMTSLIVAINGLLEPEALTVEYLAAPLGVDEARPLFGFQFVHPRRGITVAGFDLQVATDASFSSLIWDVHAKSRPLIYGGDAPLQADTQYFWRVRPRHDNLNDTRTSWAASTFRMGLSYSSR